MVVHQTIKCYSDTGSIAKRHGGGHRKTATLPEMTGRVRARIQRNPRQSATQLAKNLNVFVTSIRRILKNELKLKPHKIQKVQDLTPEQKTVRLQRSKALKALHERSELENLVFSDEKIFTVQQYVNKQNDRVWLKGKSNENLDNRLALRKQGPASVMVWAAGTANGCSPLVSIDQGVKVKQQVYQQKVLNDTLIPWARI